MVRGESRHRQMYTICCFEDFTLQNGIMTHVITHFMSTNTELIIGVVNMCCLELSNQAYLYVMVIHVMIMVIYLIEIDTFCATSCAVKRFTVKVLHTRVGFGIWVLYFHRMINIIYKVVR